MTKFQLFQAMSTRNNVVREYIASNGRSYWGILQLIEREDGSGQSFNVLLTTDNGPVEIHIRTID